MTKKSITKHNILYTGKIFFLSLAPIFLMLIAYAIFGADTLSSMLNDYLPLISIILGYIVNEALIGQPSGLLQKSYTLPVHMIFMFFILENLNLYLLGQGSFLYVAVFYFAWRIVGHLIHQVLFKRIEIQKNIL